MGMWLSVFHFSNKLSISLFHLIIPHHFTAKVGETEWFLSTARLKGKRNSESLIHMKCFLNSYTTVERLICCVQTFPAEIQEAKAPSPSINRQASIETDRVSKEFIEFLKTYHKPGQDIYKQCKLFLDTMNHKRVSDLHAFCIHKMGKLGRNWENAALLPVVFYVLCTGVLSWCAQSHEDVVAAFSSECSAFCGFDMLRAPKPSNFSVLGTLREVLMDL